MNPCALVVVLAAALTLAACSERKAPEPPPPVAIQAARPEPSPGETDTSSALPSGRSDPECLGPIDTGVPQRLTVAGRKLEWNGYRLRLEPADADDTAVIGVIADVNEASPENLFNIERYLKFFADNGVELVLVAGDSGDDRPAIEAVLRKVAASGLPTVAIAGNREAKSDFVDAINAARKDLPNLVNGNRVRWIAWDDVDLLTLPGYHDPRYIQAGESGCRYYREDLDALTKLASEARPPVLLVAHGVPKGTAPTGIDAILGDETGGRTNVGDPALTAMMASTRIPFGIFPNIQEAGGRAVADLAGSREVPEGQASDTLYLNPGSADSRPWTMNDGSTATGIAAVVTVKGRQASYRLYRATTLTDAEVAQAARLAPAPAPDHAADRESSGKVRRPGETP